MVARKALKVCLPWLMAIVLTVGMFPDCRAFADDELATADETTEVPVSGESDDPQPEPQPEGDEPPAEPVVEPEQDPIAEDPIIEPGIDEGEPEGEEIADPEMPEQPEDVVEPGPEEEEQPEQDSEDEEEVVAEDDEELGAAAEAEDSDEAEGAAEEGEEADEKDAAEEEETEEKDAKEPDKKKDDERAKKAQPKASVSYCAHVQNIGWQKSVKDGATAGTSGRSLRVEALKITVDSNVKGGISYCAHVQNIGWQGYATNGGIAGTSGRSLRVEALKVKLTGELAKKFDVYYRVHVQDFGWLDWASNGAPAGSEGLSKRVEAVQIKLVKKGAKAPGATGTPFKQNLIKYYAHVQNIGWQSAARDGEIAGTTGQSLRVEAFSMSLGSGLSGGIEYCTHVQNIGWQGYASNGGTAGTTGQSLRVEALKVRLTGAAAKQYDVYYRAHVQDYGWLGWAKNGAPAGSEGLAKRVEAVQVQLVPKGGAAPGSAAKPFAKTTVAYRLYERGVGWSSWGQNGSTAGTTGQSIPTEGFTVKVADLGVAGSVRFSAHVQNVGWTDESTMGKSAGRPGKNLRLEAITIRLTGKAANTYDIYYRVHCANYGWLDWAKNGQPAGTEGYAKAIEAMEVKLVRSGGTAPGSTARPFVGKFGVSSGTSTDTLRMTLDQMASWQPPYTNGKDISTVRSLLDPNNCKPGTAEYYQFANLTNYTGLTAAQIDNYIASTPLGRSGTLKGQGLAFVAASKKYGVNECYLVAHAVLETGWGTSDLARGFYYNGRTYYNFYGIGAYDGSALSGGRGAAVKYGWDSPSAAIMGAAKFVSEEYLNASPYRQNTLYGMKWDYLRSNDTMERGWHQYASEPTWPPYCASLMDECYRYNGVKPSFGYTVPKYKG